MILEATDPYAPTINSIIGGFALVIGLAILREFQKMYQWRVKNENLPDLTHSIRDALWGDEHGKIGIIEQLRRLAEQLNDHCTDERKFWDEVRDGREAIANRAQVTISESETRLRSDFTEQIGDLSRKVDTLAERRDRPRRSPPQGLKP